MTNARTRARDESGVTLILMALLLVILMIFAAFAVDVSGVYTARRGDQNAADAAALGGLQTLLAPGSTEADVSEKVIELAAASIGSQVTGYDWNSCTTDDDDSIDTPVDGKNCITSTAAKDVLQVRIPVQIYDAGFARVAGATLKHSAFAIAGIESVGLGGVLPLPLAPGAGGGDGYVCVRTGPGGSLDAIPPCDKQVTGGFGNVDFEFWQAGCKNGEPKDRWATNVARGVDHVLSLYGASKKPWGINEKTDQALCPGTLEQRPNAAETPATNGVTTQIVADALFNGLSGGAIPGRLALTSGTELADNDRTTIGSVSVDNNGLWEFITPGLDSSVSDVPESCEEHNFVPGDTELPPDLQAYFSSGGVTAVDRLRILLQRCISHYNAASGGVFTVPGIVGYAEAGACGPAKNQQCTGVVFGRDSDPTEAGFDIQFTPRFAYVPELHSTTPLTEKIFRFASFRPVYLQRLFGGQCTANCSWTFEPDPMSSPTPTYFAEDKAAGMTVFVLPGTSLPGELGKEDAPFDVGVNLTPRLLR